MNRITKNTIVNDALRMKPQTLKVFTKYGIDACCGSYMSIEEGAKRAKADLKTLLMELNRC